MTERGPACERRRTAAQRVFSDSHVRKITAGPWTGLVDHTEVAAQEDAPFPRVTQDSKGGRVGVGNGVKVGDCFRRRAYVPRVFDLRLVDGYHRVPTAIRTSGAVLVLHIASQDLKRLVGVMVRKKVPAKGELLFQLRGSEPKNFS